MSFAVKEFMRTGYLLKDLNTTWVTLIPKIKDVVDIENFRPISMIGVVYKIISKLLSNRLKPVMNDLIDEAQTTFVSNRQILDGIFIAK